MKTWIILAGVVLAGLSGAASAQRLPKPIVGSDKPYVAILMWHDVIASEKKQVWFDTTRSEFRSQLEKIRRGGFHVVSLGVLLEHLTMGKPLPSRPLVLTFDDNNLGLYENAFPLLKQYRYPATFFVHTDYVGVTTDKQHCTWAQLRELQASGLVSVQPHTCSHPADMTTLSDAANLRELRNSKAAVERNLGVNTFAFSYPDGKYNLRVAELVAQAGFRIAVMEDWGNAGASSDLMRVHRYSIHRRFEQALRDVERASKSPSTLLPKRAGKKREVQGMIRG